MKNLIRLLLIVVLIGAGSPFLFPDTSSKALSAIQSAWYNSDYTGNISNPEIEYQRGLFFSSFETPTDDDKAFAWYLKAAEQGHAKAQQRVGIFCLNGKGTNRDIPKALSYFEKAANQGDEQSLNILVYGYRSGLYGIPRNEAKAAFWTQKYNQSKH